MTVAVAPGKIILAGEYAAVYGYPALAVAVNRTINTAVQAGIEAGILQLGFTNIKKTTIYPLAQLSLLYKQLLNKYEQFKLKRLSIEQLLSAPFELILFSLATLWTQFDLPIATGLKINITSNLNIGSGMGSSAAAALSVQHAVAQYFSLELGKSDYYSLAMQSERIQHGYPSGLDVYTSLYGGCWCLQQQQALSWQAPSFPLYIVNTGQPEATTGECVSDVTEHYPATSRIWQDLSALTQDVKNYLLVDKPIQSYVPLVRQLHRLLVRIGVVPNKVQKFVAELEQQGAAAKICGAGSIKGDKAGIVWLITDSPETLTPLCKRYGYNIEALKVDKDGLRS